MKRIDIITMGCSKNLVDSERLMARLHAKGYRVEHNSHDVCGEVVIVNTCGFIGDAKAESIEMILDLAAAKAEGKIGRIYVMGCLSERYRKELPQELPEVDGWYGKFDWDKIIDALPTVPNHQSPIPNPQSPTRDKIIAALPTVPTHQSPIPNPQSPTRDKIIAALPTVPNHQSPIPNPQSPTWERTLTTPPYTAYLKIAEGCNRFCAFCAIPLITGRYTSRPIEEILQETRALAARGVKEFNVIAQDLSAYGSDFKEYSGERSPLAVLLDSMADISGVEWIRLHYAYPVEFPWDITEVMRRRPNICNYLDIALQHISTKVLTNMRRHIDRQATLALIARLRKEVPGIRLRTTLMVGFPGEGDEEFSELMAFVRQAQFDRMGAFAYSEEEDTYAALHYEDSIPEATKQQRLDLLMAAQEEVSLQLHKKLIGSTVRVLIESTDGAVYIGRTQWDSPEVDPVVLVHSQRALTPGEFVEVEITDADAYELTARLNNPNT